MLPAAVADAVFATPAVASKVEAVVGDALRRFARANATELDDDVVDWLRGLQAAARTHREIRANDVVENVGAPTSRTLSPVTVPGDDEITVTEAARLRHCSPQAIYARIGRGTLLARWVDGRRRVSRREIEELTRCKNTSGYRQGGR
jgi:hypothetical protein